MGAQVMLTTIHMIVCWLCSGLALRTAAFRPKPGTTVSPALRRKVAGLALAFCLSVTCGNVALRFIYVSFAQMVNLTLNLTPTPAPTPTLTLIRTPTPSLPLTLALALTLGHGRLAPLHDPSPWP